MINWLKTVNKIKTTDYTTDYNTKIFKFGRKITDHNYG